MNLEQKFILCNHNERIIERKPQTFILDEKYFYIIFKKEFIQK